MLYSKSSNGFYARAVHGTNIPDDAVEIDGDLYSALMQGQADGKVIVSGSNGIPKISEPETQPERAPLVVSRFQARRALKDSGDFAAVESAIAQADEFTQDAWADAQEFRYDSEMIVSLCSALGLDRDALFIAAAKIQA